MLSSFKCSFTLPYLDPIKKDMKTLDIGSLRTPTYSGDAMQPSCRDQRPVLAFKCPDVL